ncbi:hypothetical protein STRDD11_00473 [Streptococcus sp. DD11]|nr:hypothetical protein STRDD11_00473 [Streptococcus sp. DD11]
MEALGLRIDFRKAASKSTALRQLNASVLLSLILKEYELGF